MSILAELKKVHYQQERAAGRLMTMADLRTIAQQIINGEKPDPKWKKAYIVTEPADMLAVTPKYAPCPSCKQLPQESDFQNEVERKENNLSGMCAPCQRGFFKPQR